MSRRPNDLERKPPLNGTLGPIAIAIVNLHFGLLLWIVDAFLIVADDLPGVRAAWSQDIFFGMSAYACCAFIVVALFCITLFSAIVDGRERTIIDYRTIGYGANVVFLAAIGWVLYALQTSLLDDEWFAQAVRNESLEPRGFWVGRIISVSSERCRAEAVICLLVELESGDVAPAELLDLSDRYPIETTLRRQNSDGNWVSEPVIIEEPEPSAVVYVEEMVGPFSGVTYYQASYVDHPDPETLWRSVTRGQ